MDVIVTLGSALLVTILTHTYCSINGWTSWLLAINLVTLLTFRYDKRIAGTQRRRVSEKALLLLSAVGGSPLGFLSMQIFRHKTLKVRFRRKFWFIVALQAGLALVYSLLHFSWPIK